MRKITFLFCVLMIVPTLTLANSDMVSVSELRQQVERMGRWTKNYDTPNGEVSVDIPVIVHDVDELPILEIQAVTPEDDGFSWDENDQSVYIIYLNDRSPETYTLYPMWVLDCDYVENKNKEIKVNPYSDDIRDCFSFERICINPETAEMMDFLNPKTSMLYAP